MYHPDKCSVRNGIQGAIDRHVEATCAQYSYGLRTTQHYTVNEMSECMLRIGGL